MKYSALLSDSIAQQKHSNEIEAYVRKLYKKDKDITLQELLIAAEEVRKNVNPDSARARKFTTAGAPTTVPANFKDTETTIDTIIKECIKNGFTLHQTAYTLATVRKEAGPAFKPVKYAYWQSEDWRRENTKAYYPYYGRGFVQIVWKGNYEKFSKILGIDLVNNPDLALEPSNALIILVYGLKNGTFTGVKISDFINAKKIDFYNARKCVNALESAAIIEGYAMSYVDRVSKYY